MLAQKAITFCLVVLKIRALPVPNPENHLIGLGGMWDGGAGKRIAYAPEVLAADFDETLGFLSARRPRKSEGQSDY
ncbi:hypothetical protein LMH87_010893 [Akanthomyces muscarius]|uniref:Uncharacterized protein n=1 Tax=Akanthomyces muscarius TaxID=2231603 RepID=A0A9W8QAP1_AKAMU|nr:hypothetical protein LMH87_010893 [Akanthomyces muscarius]KAJ4150128.1 hypothetical protein LMH87_010893 [Akanthomyces muscarius]